MRVIVDPRKCQLHGDCVMTAPEVFRLDEDSSSSVVRQPVPPEALCASVRTAARNCPTGAIRVED